MTAKPRPDRLASMLKTRTGQGIVAFITGTTAFFLVGLILSGFPGVQNFLVNNLVYEPRIIPWSTADIFWGYVLNIFAGLIMMAIITALITAVMILIFRWLDVKSTWPVLRNVFLWALMTNAFIFLLSYTSHPVVAFAPLLYLGLPYMFAWLMATRKVKF